MSTQHTSNHPDDDIFELTDVVEEGGTEQSSEDVNFSPDSEDMDLSFEDELEELFSETGPSAKQETGAPARPEPHTPPAATDTDLDDIFGDQETLSSEHEEVDFDALLEDVQAPTPSAAAKPAPGSQAKDDDPFADLDFSDLGMDDIDLGLDEDKGASSAAAAPHKRPQQPADDIDFEQTIPDAEVVLPPQKPDPAHQNMDELLGDMDFGDLGDDDFDIDIDTEEQQVKSSHPQRSGASLVDQDDVDEDISDATPLSPPRQSSTGVDEDDLLADLDFSDLETATTDEFPDDLDQIPAQGGDLDDVFSDQQTADEDDLIGGLDLPDNLDDMGPPADEVDTPPTARDSAPTSDTIDQDDIDAMDFSGLDPSPAKAGGVDADDEFDELELGDLTNELDEDLPEDFEPKPTPPPVSEERQDQPDAQGEQAEDFDLDGLDDLINDLDLPDELPDAPGDEPDHLESPVEQPAAKDEPAPSTSAPDDFDEDSLELDEQDLDDLDALLSHDSDDTDLFNGIDAAVAQAPAEEGDSVPPPPDEQEIEEDTFLVQDLPPAGAPGIPGTAEEEVTFLPEDEPVADHTSEPPVEPQAPARQAALSDMPDKTTEPETDTQAQSPEPLAAELADLRSRIQVLEARLSADASDAPPVVLSDTAPNVSELVEERFSASRAAMLHDLEASIQDKLEAALEARNQELHDTLHKDMEILLRQAVSAESTAIADDVHARVEESLTRKHQESLADLGADLEERLTGILQVDGPFMERLKQLLTPEIERIAGQLSPASPQAVSEQILDARLEALRGELEERLAKEIPKAAARIIREEVAALVELMD
jgi:pilus assembly protein FimV